MSNDTTPIDANTYQQLCLRTAVSKVSPESSNDTRFLYTALGLAGETGEYVDHVKKIAFQGHKIDKYKLLEELGDIAWYLAIAAAANGFSLSSVFNMNIKKLRERYPDGFDPAKSINRKD